MTLRKCSNCGKYTFGSTHERTIEEAQGRSIIKKDKKCLCGYILNTQYVNKRR